jgi:proteic killer suppression protein
MIDGWRDRWLEEFFKDDVHAKKIPADLRVPPSNHFEKLSGSLEGLHSIRVNDQWRLIFRWDDGKASDVYLDDHSYR